MSCEGVKSECVSVCVSCEGVKSECVSVNV